MPGNNNKCSMVVRSKIWIEIDGKPVFSKGREMLFRAIDEHRSINQAAKEMGISYRRAWSYVHAMEERLGLKLVETRKGGASGGGAQLTENAQLLLSRFEQLEHGFNTLIDNRFDKLFKGVADS